MKVTNILLGQVVRLAKVSGAGGGNIYGLNLARACEERYGFLQSPHTLPDYDLAKGVTFLHGYFQRKFVIDRFQVFNNGLLVEAKLDTDHCEEFLDDVMEWVRGRGIEIDEDPSAPRFFLSQLEIDPEVVLSSAFRSLTEFGRVVADILRGYNQITSDWELAGISFGGAGSGQASAYKFERREGSPNLFFGSAVLKTSDHVKTLSFLEDVLRHMTIVERRPVG
jgi:hypothetical protein